MFNEIKLHNDKPHAFIYNAPLTPFFFENYVNIVVVLKVANPTIKQTDIRKETFPFSMFNSILVGLTVNSMVFKISSTF